MSMANLLSMVIHSWLSLWGHNHSENQDAAMGGQMQRHVTLHPVCSETP